MKGPTSMALGPHVLSSWALYKEGQEPPFCWLTARREHDVPRAWPCVIMLVGPLVTDKKM